MWVRVSQVLTENGWVNGPGSGGGLSRFETPAILTTLLLALSIAGFNGFAAALLAWAISSDMRWAISAGSISIVFSVVSLLIFAGTPPGGGGGVTGSAPRPVSSSWSAGTPVEDTAAPSCSPTIPSSEQLTMFPSTSRKSSPITTSRHPGHG